MFVYKKKRLGKLKWEENITIGLKKIVVTQIIWIDSTKDRDYSRALVYVALNLKSPGISWLILIILLLFVYRVSIFSHLSVPKVLFSFFIFPVDPFHVVNFLLSHFSCY